MSFKIVFVVLALVVSVALANPTKKNNFIEQENSCRQVCGLCDCDGFYCEDECICECNLEDDSNLQCIADMKKECDRNGLEYELLMKESTKDRFLREVEGKNLDVNNHLVVLKHKRQSGSSNSSDPIIGAAAPPAAAADPTVGAPPPPAAAADPTVGAPPPPAVAAAAADPAVAAAAPLAEADPIVAAPILPFAAGNLQASKLLILLRNNLATLRTRSGILPIVRPVVPPVVAPVVATAAITPVVTPVVTPVATGGGLLPFAGISSIPGLNSIRSSLTALHLWSPLGSSHSVGSSEPISSIIGSTEPISSILGSPESVSAILGSPNPIKSAFASSPLRSANPLKTILGTSNPGPIVQPEGLAD